MVEDGYVDGFWGGVVDGCGGGGGLWVVASDCG